MTSASEAEVAALFYNCKAAQPLNIALEEIGHPQPKTLVITDDKIAEGLSNKTMVPVVQRVPILPNRPDFDTTNINVFLGICFSTYFTIQFILIPIHIGI